jgi:hypothetical protein
LPLLFILPGGKKGEAHITDQVKGQSPEKGMAPFIQPLEAEKPVGV